MLHIAVISLAIGNLALLFGFMWMNCMIQRLRLKIKFLEDNAFRIYTFDEYCSIRCKASFSCPMRGDRNE